MFLGIRLEGWLTILAIIVGPLLAFEVQRRRDNRREHRNRKLDIYRTLLLSIKVPMAQRHVDAINSIPLEFYSAEETMKAWRLYTSHLNDHHSIKQNSQGWGAKKFDLLVDLAYEVGQNLGYTHIDKATLRDNMYVPQGYTDMEEEWRQIRASWLKVLNGQSPLVMTVVGPIQIEEPLKPVQEITVAQTRRPAPALPPAPIRND